MKFEGFLDGHLGGHLKYRTRTIFSNSESLCRFDVTNQVWGHIHITVWEEMSFEEFHDCLGGHHKILEII